nr:reverse transcriptase domain-containing protein [Tanacetum cinerariifolium]
MYHPSKSSSMSFPSRLKKQKKDDDDERLLSIFRQIRINLPFLKAMIHMPKGAKFLKDLLLHKKLKKQHLQSSSVRSAQLSSKRAYPKRRETQGRCMMAIFDELIEDSMEVFMDDFSIFESSFDHCVKNLEKMIKRCEETNLVLNWEKCHFMVKEGIVLSHKVSGSGIEVDKAKIKLISKFPYPTNVKAIQSFLGHAGFYRRFIKDFSQVVRLMTQLLVKDAPFNFSKEGIQDFDKLKQELTQSLIMIKPNWSSPFEVMRDASDYDVGAVLGQMRDKHFLPIHYASKLKSRWYGPFTVSKDMKSGAIELCDKERNEFIVNKQRVKPYQKDVLEFDADDDVTLEDEGGVT